MIAMRRMSQQGCPIAQLFGHRSSNPVFAGGRDLSKSLGHPKEPDFSTRFSMTSISAHAFALLPGSSAPFSSFLRSIAHGVHDHGFSRSSKTRFEPFARLACSFIERHLRALKLLARTRAVTAIRVPNLKSSRRRNFLQILRSGLQSLRSRRPAFRKTTVGRRADSRRLKQNRLNCSSNMR